MKKVLDFISDKKIAVLAALLFLLSLAPILYLGQYARPSGDDYGYGVLTHAAWVDTHSLWQVFRAGIATVGRFYQSWNGDWFTVFLFSLMPEVFAPFTYWIVPYLMVGALILSTTVFLHDVLVRTGKLPVEYFVLLDVLILTAGIQFIPSTGIGMYWYVGAVHYIIPHAAALLAFTAAFRFRRTGRIGNLVAASLLACVVGGGSYFSSLLLFMVFFLLIVLSIRKNKKISLLSIPFAICLIGFIIQCVSPGNAIRAGENFGFHIRDVFTVIGGSLLNGIRTLAVYGRERPAVYVLLLLCAVFGWAGLIKSKSEADFRFPLLFVFFMFGFYSAMYAPALYAAVDVSLGPDTMVFLTFLLCALLSTLYVEGWLIRRLRLKERNNLMTDSERHHRWVTLPALLLCFLLLLVNRSWLAGCVDKQVYDYVKSGQAEDFKRQWDANMEILLDDSVKEAYLAPSNDEQGPLLHMPVTDKEDAFTNWVVKEFYRKDKVVTVSERQQGN